MQAVILAAGKGSRLHPLTMRRTKAMLPILGKPLVERVMDTLVDQVDEFIFVVSPQDTEIAAYFESKQVKFAFQERRMGMAHALQCAAPLVKGDFILSACDNLVPHEHICQLISAWQRQPQPNAVLSLMQASPEQLSRSGVVALDGEHVRRIVEKPSIEQAPSNIASLPLYIFSHLILGYLHDVPLSPRGEYELQDAIQMLIDQHGAALGILTTQRQTVTNADDLLALNLALLAKTPCVVDLKVKINSNIKLIPPVVIEDGTIIEKNCNLGPYVYIERDCQIGENSTLCNSIVLRNAQLPAGTRIDHQVYR